MFLLLLLFYGLWSEINADDGGGGDDDDELNYRQYLAAAWTQKA